MQGTPEFEELMASIRADGMVMRHIELATEEVVFLKGVLEAYPGVAAVHAPPGANVGSTARLMLATSPGFAAELDGVLADLAADLQITEVSVG